MLILLVIVCYQVTMLAPSYGSLNGPVGQRFEN